MKKKSLVLLLIGTAVFWAACAFGEPGTFNVPSETYPTIQSAIDNAVNGNTVIVAPGTYSENINFGGKAITVKSEDPDDPSVVASTVIDAGGVGSVVTFENSEGPDSVLSGFTITGGTGTLNDSLGVSINWGSGVYCWQASPTITKNVVTGNAGPSDNGYGGGVGCFESQAIISNNIIKDNSGYAGGGICVIGGDAKIGSNLIYGNLADAGGGVVLLNGRLIGNTIVENTAPDGGNVFVDDYDQGPCLVMNNIIASAIGGQELGWNSEIGYEAIKYNNFWNDTGSNYSNIPDQTGLNGNISVDPLFVNADGHDYHLSGDSNCINAGDPDPGVLVGETDIDGEVRIFAGRVDIGADEYTGYIKPKANAGQDQIVTSKGSTVTLDGSGSFFIDPAGTKKYSWSQVSGPEVVLSDDKAVDPSFDAVEYGSYVFELVVNDGEMDSLPDTVVVYCGKFIVHSEAYPTIQSAIDSAGNGDTVMVTPGTYTENINFGGKAITLTSANPDDPEVVASTIIDGGGAGSVVTFATSEGRGSVLSGFTITGGTGTLNDSLGVTIYWGCGVYCWQASPTIRNNVITGNDGTYSNVQGGGVACYNSDALISNNIIAVNSAYNGGGVRTLGGNTMIRNNLIYSNNAYVGGGVYLGAGQLVGNTLVGNNSRTEGTVFVRPIPEDSQCFIINNIIANSTGGHGLCWELTDKFENISYNVFWNNVSGDYGDIPDQTGLNGNISVDPLFVNPDGHDYHLRGDSFCINSGDPDFAVLGDERDIDGEVRIFAGRVDIGADEYTGYIKPRANAGRDQIVTSKGSTVTLDASGSLFNDPVDKKEYSWARVSGPEVVLSDDKAVDPSFVVVEYGSYVFELVVNDGLYGSLPDTVVVTFDNVIPVADAGAIQYFNDVPASITLDASGSFDVYDDELTYSWRQVEGPLVELSDVGSVNPTFVPSEFAVYVFELIVSDGIEDSEPDFVGIVIGNNHAPIADAGSSLYAGTDPIVLDGTGSYDPDFHEGITYKWTQLSGPAGVISGADTATPTVSGFTQTTSIQECVFQLVVSDGDKDSIPDTVKVRIVPSFGQNTLKLRNPFFDPAKPTIVAFGGGNCNTGGPMTFDYLWEDKVNWITTSDSYGPPYESYGDMLMVYLSSVAPDYKEPIQAMGFSTGNMLAMIVATRSNLMYSDPRYAVNRVSLLDAACHSKYDYQPNINELVNNPVDGEKCWIDNYYATHGKKFDNTLNISFSGGDHTDPAYWYADSIVESSYPGGDMYNGGIMAGYYYSVAGPGKNLQLASDESKYYFKWINSDPDYLTFYNQYSYPGRLPEAVTLIYPVAMGSTIVSNGVLLTCEESENVVGYQLLVGSDPYRVMDYTVLSDTPAPPDSVITEFPEQAKYWTIRAYDQYGSTIYADPLPLIYLSCTGYDVVSEKMLSQSQRECRVKMKLKNMCDYDVSDLTLKLKSAANGIEILNDKVWFGEIAPQSEGWSEDTFIVKIDTAIQSGNEGYVWSIEGAKEGDFSGDGQINVVDLGFIANNWLQTGSDMPEDIYKDRIINLIDLAIFAEQWINNLSN